MNVTEFTAALYNGKRDIDAAFVEYDARIHEDAEADDIARREKAKAYLRARETMTGKPTVDEVRAWVDLETSIVQRQARLAEGLKRSAGMAVDAKKQWLSALQSLASLTKAEAQLAKWEPSEVA